MRIDELFYRSSYRFGRPGWDTVEPTVELAGVAESGPGRALDLGCGTGANAIFFARLGWEVVGVDFAPEAIGMARARARAAGSTATFVEGDVAHLGELGINGAFDLLIDVGCFHALPARLRPGYAKGVGDLARPGADLYIAGISDPPLSWRLLRASGVDSAEIRRRFGERFDFVGEQSAGSMGRARELVLYHLVRRPVDTAHAVS